jgi:hypothetical protein
MAMKELKLRDLAVSEIGVWAVWDFLTGMARYPTENTA